MTLQKQTISLPFAKGLDTKTDPKQIPLGRLELLQNATFETPGSVRKRNGSANLSSIANGSYGLTTYKGELTHIGRDDKLRTWSPETGLWRQRGEFTPMSLQDQRVFASTETPTIGVPATTIDMATHEASGLALMAWTGYDPSSAVDTLSYSIIDTTTGTQIVAASLIAGTAYQPKAMVFGSYLILVYNDKGNSTLKLRYFNTATPTTGGTDVDLGMMVGAVTVANFDAVVLGTTLYVINRNVSTGAMLLRSVSSAFALSGIVTVNASATKPAIWADATRIWTAYYDGANIKATVYTSSLVVAIAEFTVAASGPQLITGIFQPTLTGNSHLFWNVSVGPVSPECRTVQITPAGVVGTSSVFSRSLAIYSKPVIGPTAEIVLAMSQLAPSAAYPESLYLVRVDGPARVFAKIASNIERRSSFVTANMSLTNSGRTFDLATGIVTNTEYSSVASTWNRLAFGVNVPSAEIAGVLHLGGGVLSSYDGSLVTEHGFHTFPPVAQFGATPNPVGGSMASGSYSYVLTYEWVDAQGNLYRSAPSDPKQVTTSSGTSQVALNLPTLRVTQKQTAGITERPVKIAIYRTQVNGQTYNLVATVNNDISVDQVNYADTMSDADLLDNITLYTDGGEVPNGEPGAVLAMTTYKNRLIVIPADDRLSFWYSKTVTQNVPAELSADFVQPIEPQGGDLTACAAMDDKLILFKQSVIIAVTGNGPDLNGGNNDFTQGQIIATDSGCTSTPSVVLSSDGLLYQSGKGIELLTRGLVTEYIGADVEAYTSVADVVSATLIAQRSQVRFVLSSGVILVYDYFVKDERGLGQWSVFTGFSNVVASTVFQTEFAYALVDGTVRQEDASFQDGAATSISLLAKTPWISMAGLQGFQRIYKAIILGEWKSAHTLTVQIAYDFDSTIVQTETISAAALSTPYQWRILLNRQKCEAIQFTISDSGTGESLRLSAIGLEVGIKGGLQRSGKTRTFG